MFWKPSYASYWRLQGVASQQRHASTAMDHTGNTTDRITIQLRRPVREKEKSTLLLTIYPTEQALNHLFRNEVDQRPIRISTFQTATRHKNKGTARDVAAGSFLRATIADTIPSGCSLPCANRHAVGGQIPSTSTGPTNANPCIKIRETQRTWAWPRRSAVLPARQLWGGECGGFDMSAMGAFSVT